VPDWSGLSDLDVAAPLSCATVSQAGSSGGTVRPLVAMVGWYCSFWTTWQ
jgi:hypothetical protein